VNSSLAKKPAGFMREHTQQVRDHSSAMARLTDQYVAALKRAEAQYFDGVKRITDAISSQTTEAAQENEPDHS
jgi:hypothetical protein